MAGRRPDTHGLPEGTDFKWMSRRRKVMLSVGLLLAIVVACIAAIVIMLQRLEARTANFQPPMTAVERLRLLPHDPVLDISPKLEGLRYRDETQIKAGDTSSEEVREIGQIPLSHALILRSDDLHAIAHQGLRPASQTP